MARMARMLGTVCSSAALEAAGEVCCHAEWLQGSLMEVPLRQHSIPQMDGVAGKRALTGAWQGFPVAALQKWTASAGHGTEAGNA